MSKSLDYKIKKLEKGPLQRFKNQNAVLKKFGEDGLRLYRAATGKKTAQQLIAELDLDVDFAAEVIAWLEDKEMIQLIPVEEEAVAKKKDEKEEAEPKKIEKAEEEIEEFKIPKKEEEKKEEKAKEEVEEEPLLLTRRSKLRELVESEKEIEEPVKKEMIEKEESTLEEEIKPESGEDEITPISENEEIEPEIKEEEPMSEEEEITPISEEEEQEIQPETSEELEAAAEEEIEPEIEEAEREEVVEEETSEEPTSLSPVEKTIKERYGDIGLKVYALIDGQKTAEEIMNETGVSEAKLIEMLEFMEKQGIIKLEHPEQKVAAEPEDMFVPLSDREGELQIKDINPVEVPTKLQFNFLKEFQIEAKIIFQYGEKGIKIFKLIDGNLSEVDIAIKLGLPLYEVRDVLSFLIANQAINIKQLKREEISHRYGDDCLTVYKKYGREGVLLYELIGKDLGIKQLYALVTKDKNKFAEMFIFIHKVLGVDIPIDKDVIFSQLEK